MRAPWAIITVPTVWPLMSMPRIASAAACASSGLLVTLTPPALPRPPVFTCALTTVTPPDFGPICSAAARASSGVVAMAPASTGTPCFSNMSRAWYSKRSTGGVRPRRRFVSSSIASLRRPGAPVLALGRALRRGATESGCRSDSSGSGLRRRHRVGPTGQRSHRHLTHRPVGRIPSGRTCGVCRMPWGAGGVRAGLRAASGGVDVLADPADDLHRRRAGREDLGDAELLERGDVVVGDDAAAEDDDVARVTLGEQLDDPREEGQVRPGEDREPDDVGVLLDGRLDDLLGRLVQAGVDDLHARVAQRARDDLRAAGVATTTRMTSVETGPVPVALSSTVAATASAPRDSLMPGTLASPGRRGAQE